MAIHKPGKPPIVLSSVPFQLLLYLTALYYAFYFMSTLSILIYKSQVLSYPYQGLVTDVSLLFLMAALEAVRLFFGVRGNLLEREGYVVANMCLTGATVLLSIYFLVWQSYVLRVDAIINAVLLAVYGLGGLSAFITVARFTSVYS